MRVWRRHREVLISSLKDTSVCLWFLDCSLKNHVRDNPRNPKPGPCFPDHLSEGRPHPSDLTSCHSCHPPCSSYLFTLLKLTKLFPPTCFPLPGWLSLLFLWFAFSYHVGLSSQERPSPIIQSIQSKVTPTPLAQLPVLFSSPYLADVLALPLSCIILPICFVS